MEGAEEIKADDVLGPPQPLIREIAEGLPFPVEALGPLRSAVEAVQRKTKAPVAIAAQSALAVAALAAQAHANVDTLGGFRPLSLYCLTIATSGERKSSCDALLMQAMGDFERQESQGFGKVRSAWLIDHAIWKKREEGILVRIKGGKGDRAELEALGPEPAAPPLPDRLVTEPTYEGLTKLFALGQPTLGLFSDEGGQFLGGFAMSQDNKQKTMAAFNDLWMGNPIKRTRQGDGAFTLYGRRLSLHLMVQPGVAYAFLGDPLAGDTGFLPRCLICEPGSTIGTRFHDPATWDGTPLQKFSDRLADILHTGIAMDPDTRELKPRLLPLSADARALLIEYSDEVERAQAPGGEFELVKGHASKSAEQAARLAGVLSLWNDTGTQEVPRNAMGWGIALARFYLSEAKRLGNAATVSVAVGKAEALRKWMVSESWGKTWLTLREVVRLGPSRLRESPEALKAVEMLVEHGWLIPMAKGSMIEGKATRQAWRICA
ncbi:MAG: YfjI family protein [Novosphingobium sp.]